MKRIRLYQFCLTALVFCIAAATANAQSFRVQCPGTTKLHNTAGASVPYTGPTTANVTITPDVGNPFTVPYVRNGGAVKCQQLSGGDGFASMADGTQTYMFSFGPLSGLSDIANGLPGTELASVFNTPFTTAAAVSNGAVGLIPDADNGGAIDGHVDPRLIMDVGVLNGNQPAPLIAIDEDDELFLTLTNVGQIMRPDLFEQHTVHFHGYPNASSFYDGVPDASVAINIGGSFTYYYLAPDAGTYFWHCHITPPEHLQMGMVGQLYVRPRQNRVPANGTTTLYSSLLLQQNDPRTKCGTDILCATPLPPSNTATHANNKSGQPTLYAYNDGNGSTAYDVEYPVQMMGFDPDFHFVGMTFNPEGFVDMKDKYFLLNGRGYPDTVNATGYKDTTNGVPGIPYNGVTSFQGQPLVSKAIYTQSSDGVNRPSQPLPTVINIPAGGRALLRISDLNVTEYHTLASLGIPMRVIALNARLLRDLAGNDLTYLTNSITLGGGESLDVILDASGPGYAAGQTYYLYTSNLDHLSNDAENFGGMMTEVHICNAVNPTTKACS